MSKKRKWTKPLAGAGCLSIIGIVIVLVVTVAIPKLKSMVNGDSNQSEWDLMGPTIDQTVTIGTVSEGIKSYGTVRPYREASLAFGYGNATVSLVNAMPGMPVTQGDILVQVDTAERERALAQAKADLQEAQDALDALLNGVDSAASRLELQVELAEWQDKLTDAEHQLAEFDAGKGTPAEERQRALQELEQAQSTLATLRDGKDNQEQLDYLRWIYNQSEVKHGEMTVIQNPSEQDRDIEWLLRIDMEDKYQSLRQAEIQYEVDIANAEQAVVTARQKLARLDAEIALGSQGIAREEIVAEIAAANTRISQINAALTNLAEDQDTSKVAEARAEVLKKQGLLEEAQNAMVDSQLVAPFEGIISEVNVFEFAHVTAGSTAVIVQDMSTLKIIAQMSEVDVARIESGTPVLVTFDALPGEQVQGNVGELPLTGSYQSGITTYQVPITIDTATPGLMPGMSANVIVPLENHENVLVIPSAAVFREYGDKEYVWLVQDNDIEKQYIETGVNDGLNTEITSGLEEGQIVRMVTQGYSPSFGGGMYW